MQLSILPARNGRVPPLWASKTFNDLNLSKTPLNSLTKSQRSYSTVIGIAYILVTAMVVSSGKPIDRANT